MSKKRVAVVGVGNVLMADDGVGPAAIAALAECGQGGDADLIDAGTSFHEVIFDLEGYEKLIIVDAVQGREEPGAIYRIELDDIRDARELPFRHLSVHELSILPTLLLQEMGGRKFSKVVLIGVEPKKIEWQFGLSARLKSLMPALVDALTREIGAQASPCKEEKNERNKPKTPG